ncbi:hypothetical protein RHGRI_025385 [Rhododendron griersonianum]|uniref:Uncharacterized protein n=1 Tax=Rhododendron griersonianum TaxID=479676 RepID=A0AAV6ITH2_9ERIC|nr:hypothetical protein RHGRI_025385 [Rhododendron griersonianum]
MRAPSAPSVRFRALWIYASGLCFSSRLPDSSALSFRLCFLEPLVRCASGWLALVGVSCAFESFVFSVSGLMVVHAPFIRWDIIKDPFAVSKRRVLYYLETAQGDVSDIEHQPFGTFGNRSGYTILLHRGPSCSPSQVPALQPRVVILYLHLEFLYFDTIKLSLEICDAFD